MEFPKTYSNGVVVEDVVMGSGVWSNAEHTFIDLLVKFRQFPEPLGFTATENDSEEHGRELFQTAKDGYFGGIAPFVVTPEQVAFQVQQLTNEATTRIASLSNEVATLQDAVDLEMAEPSEEERLPKAKAELTAWKKYRILLSRVPAQAGYPTKVDWPAKPA